MVINSVADWNCVCGVLYVARQVLRMMANQAIDTCVGVIPFLGDIFDFGFKVRAVRCGRVRWFQLV